MLLRWCAIQLANLAISALMCTEDGETFAYLPMDLKSERWSERLGWGVSKVLKDYGLVDSSNLSAMAELRVQFAKDYPPEPGNPVGDGWLSPLGEFYQNVVSEVLVAAHYSVWLPRNLADEHLLRQGWYSFRYDRWQEQLHIRGNGDPTDLQFTTMKKMYESGGGGRSDALRNVLDRHGNL